MIKIYCKEKALHIKGKKNEKESGAGDASVFKSTLAEDLSSLPSAHIRWVTVTYN